MTPADGRVAALAARQHGVVTRTQARDAGLSNDQLARRVDAGVLRPVGRSVFVVAAAPDTFRQKVMAGTLSVPGSLASHEAAAHLHVVEPLPLRRIVILARDGSTSRALVDRFHRTNYLPERQRVEIDGIPTTSLVRTILDLASMVGRHRLEEMIDGVVAAQRLPIGELVDEFNEFAQSGRRGASRLRPLVRERADGRAVPASVLERRMLALIVDAHLPVPLAQWSPPWGGSMIGRVDFAYLDHRLLVEVDGRKWHSRVNDFEVDHRRDQLAVMAQWRVLRFTWRQVTRRPDEVVDTLAAALSVQQAG